MSISILWRKIKLKKLYSQNNCIIGETLCQEKKILEKNKNKIRAALLLQRPQFS